MTVHNMPKTNWDMNNVLPEDQAVHDWYRFVLSFPPHLVKQYAYRFDVPAGGVVLDPFCGTGTTLVECKKQGINCVGIEPNPMAHFASRVKLDWRPDPDRLLARAEEVAAAAHAVLDRDGVEDIPLLRLAEDHEHLLSLPPESQKLLLRDSISPLPLHKVLRLLQVLSASPDDDCGDHLRLALAKVLPTAVGNLRFGPEVGVGKVKTDAPVVDLWLRQVRAMAGDLRAVKRGSTVEAHVHQADARSLSGLVEPGSIDAVITSPPYPNEKDYTRIMRLESVLLGFLSDRAQLRHLKGSLLRSNTRNVYKHDDDDDWLTPNSEVARVANQIEERRLELGKTSGFERMYARVTRLYFGGMARHFADLRHLLRPGAQLAYVVGDQASFFRIMIRTGELLGHIAADLGYQVEGTDLFRTRAATATREQLREEVLLLRWPG